MAPEQSGPSLASLTANLIRPTRPLNLIVKLFRRRSQQPNGPMKQQQQTGLELERRSQPSVETSPPTTTTASNFISTLAERHRRRLVARDRKHQTTLSPPTNTTRLPRVTRSDLLGINQIHAASLNGLGGQFSQQQQPPVVQPQVEPPIVSSEQRKPAQSASVSQFANPASEPPVAAQQPPVIVNPQQRVVPGQRVAQTTTTATTAAAASSPAQLPALFTTSNPQQVAQSTASRQQQQSAPGQQGGQQSSNKFAFLQPLQPVVGGQPATTGGYDSAPIASTNSISVHSTASGPMPAGSGHHLLHGQAPTVSGGHHPAGSVLASFQPPIRPHNGLANAKYSLDGIIAVAIFGGFIFLGAIITILVIIIRR